MKTQTERVVDYVVEFGSITPLDALRDLGIMRLGARIWELEQSGVLFKHERFAVNNRWGQECHVTKYSLVGEPELCL